MARGEDAGRGPVGGRPPGSRHHAFAVAAPGLEELVAGELAALGLRSARAGRGGARFTATTRQLYAANLWLRTATRVLVRVGRFRARTFADLEAGTAEVEWGRWLATDVPVRLRVSSSGSALHHTGAVAERVHRILRRPVAGGAPEEDPTRPTAEQLVVVRIVHDEVTISVDSSGAALHRRGYRQALGRAPLRETAAAALVLAAGWDPSAPLVDPMCGSGTIAIEAALAAAGRPPGAGRAFAFQAWPDHEPGTWASVTGAVEPVDDAAVGAGRGAIVASDRDDGAVAATLANAARAGVADDLVVVRRTVSELEPPADGAGAGLVVTNPPWGRRVRGGGDLRDLHARLGSVLQERFAGWDVALLVRDRALARATGLELRPRLRTTAGGVPVELLVGRA